MLFLCTSANRRGDTILTTPLDYATRFKKKYTRRTQFSVVDYLQNSSQYLSIDSTVINTNSFNLNFTSTPCISQSVRFPPSIIIIIKMLVLASCITAQDIGGVIINAICSK